MLRKGLFTIYFFYLVWSCILMMGLQQPPSVSCLHLSYFTCSLKLVSKFLHITATEKGKYCEIWKIYTLTRCILHVVLKGNEWKNKWMNERTQILSSPSNFSCRNGPWEPDCMPASWPVHRRSPRLPTVKPTYTDWPQLASSFTSSQCWDIGPVFLPLIRHEEGIRLPSYDGIGDLKSADFNNKKPF